MENVCMMPENCSKTGHITDINWKTFWAYIEKGFWGLLRFEPAQKVRLARIIASFLWLADSVRWVFESARYLEIRTCRIPIALCAIQLSGIRISTQIVGERKFVAHRHAAEKQLEPLSELQAQEACPRRGP
jgi:hypothetical protein